VSYRSRHGVLYPHSGCFREHLIDVHVMVHPTLRTADQISNHNAMFYKLADSTAHGLSTDTKLISNTVKGFEHTALLLLIETDAVDQVEQYHLVRLGKLHAVTRHLADELSRPLNVSRDCKVTCIGYCSGSQCVRLLRIHSSFLLNQVQFNRHSLMCLVTRIIQQHASKCKPLSFRSKAFSSFTHQVPVSLCGAIAATLGSTRHHFIPKPRKCSQLLL